MLIIDLFNLEDQIYGPVLYELFYDCARDLNLGDEMSDNKTTKMFNLPKVEFLNLVETWALKKYNMFLRFNYLEDTQVNLIEVGWENIDDLDVSQVLFNMYPKENP